MHSFRHGRFGASLARAAVFCVLVVVSPSFSCRLLAKATQANRSIGLVSLDERRVFALGMIESGNNDRGVGRHGEVSRYQIHPAVWKNYSNSQSYQNREVALQVARQHWDYLTNYFRDKSGREPTDFDMYVLWNTKFGYYARRGFNADRLHRVVRDRAQRFVNLVNR